jgi:hypothetical protein
MQPRDASFMEPFYVLKHLLGLRAGPNPTQLAVTRMVQGLTVQ